MGGIGREGEGKEGGEKEMNSILCISFVKP